jgi:RHS repeat-associated protein
VTKTNVAQYNEYYPFGLTTANSWTRENNVGNNFLGNGGTELNSTTALYDLHYRNYDPVLGRMNQVDPLASKYAATTPYNFAFNDPANYNDPLGDDPGSSAHCSWCYTKPRPIDTGNGSGGGSGEGGGNPFAGLMGRSAGFFDPGWQPGSGSLSAGAFASMDARYNAYNIARGNVNALREGTYTNDGNGNFTYAPILQAYWLSSSLTFSYAKFGKEVMGTLNTVVVNGIRDRLVIVNPDVSLQSVGSLWVESGQNALDLLGALAGAAQGLVVSGDYWLGKNGKYYSNTWGGNQYTGGRSGAYKASTGYRNLGRFATVGTVVLGGIQIFDGYRADGNKFGYNTQAATASTAGGLIGGWAGAEGGATVGAGIGVWFGGVGAIPGAVIGGLIGGIGGGYLGSSIGQNTVDYYHGR